MNKYTVEFSRRANMQLRNIFSYIAQDNTTAALKMIDLLEASAMRLEITPFIGVELPKDEYPMLTEGYRMLVVRAFNLYYRVVDNTIYITHIIHHRRNQTATLKEGEHE